MMKFIKGILIFLGVLIVLLVLAVIIIPLVVDVNSFKPKIAEIVHSQTGREINIGGEIKLKILPRFSLELQDITFSNAEGFEPENMATIGQVSVGVAMWPLLRKEIRVTRVIIDNAELNYAVNAEGVTNIDDIFARQAKPDGAAEAVPAETAVESDKKGSPFNMDNFHIALLSIGNMTLNYVDGRAGTTYVLSDIHVRAEDVGFASPVDIALGAVFQELTSQIRVDADFALTANVGKEIIDVSIRSGAVNAKIPQQDLDASVSIEAAATYDLVRQLAVVDLRKGAVTAKIPRQGLDATVNIKAAAEYDLARQTVSLSSAAAGATVDLKTDNLSVNGNFNINTNGSFDLANSVFLLPSVKVDSNFTTNLLNEPQTASVDTSVTFNMKEETLDIPALAINALGVNVTGKVSGSSVMSAPNIKGDIAIGEFSPQAVLSKVNVAYQTADPTAFTQFKANSTFTFNKKVLTLPLQITLDTTNINAVLKADLSKEKPVINADISLDSINVDRYLPVPADNKIAATPAATPAAAQAAGGITIPDINIDLTPLPVVNATFKARKVTVMNNELQNIDVKATLNNGVATVAAAVGNLHGGKLSSDIKVTGRKNVFEAALNANLTSINIHDALKGNAKDLDRTNIPKKGTVAVSLTFKGRVLNISKLSVKADSLTLNGNLKGDFNPKDKPMITFRMDVGDVDVRAFVPKQSASKTAPAVAAETAPAQSHPDLSAIPVNVDGVLNVSSMTMDQYKAKNIVVNLSVMNGKVTVSPFSAQTFGGEIVINGSMKSQNGKLPGDLKVNITNLRIGDVIEAVTEKKSRFSGNLAANADLGVTGITKDEILQSLTGKMSYTLSKGALSGIGYDPRNLNIRNIRNLMVLDPNKTTSMSDITGVVSFENGRMNLQKVDLKSSYLNAVVEGGLVMKDLSMDFTGILNAEGVEVPLRITGSLSSPKVWIDMERMIGGLLTKYAADAAKEVQKEVEKNIKNEVEKGIQNLFK